MFLFFSQTPIDPDLVSHVQIVKTNFTRNGFDPTKSKNCNPSTNAVGTSWGGAIFIGSTRSINPNGANFTFEKGKLSCVLKNVSFRQNIADNGGAIAFVRASLLQLDDVNFVENEGFNGGAMFLELDGDAHPQIGFDPVHYVNGGGLLFQQNTAKRGGALYSRVRCGTGLDLVGISPYNITRVASKTAAGNEDAIFIETSDFKRNMATESGGAWYADNGRVGFLSCNFSNNSAEGGLDLKGGAITLKNKAALHVRKVTWWQNGAKHGGAVYAEDSLVDIVESDFIANVARENGGGLYIETSAAMQFRLGSVGLIESSIFDGNMAKVGGGHA